MSNYENLGQLLYNRSAAPNRGMQSLGFLLGGGADARSQEIFNMAALRGAQGADAMAKARMMQRALIERQNLENYYKGKGNPELGMLVGANAGALNPSEFAKARETQLQTDIQQEIYKRAQQPGASMAALNPLAMAFDPKPVETSKIQGDTLFNPFNTPDNQSGMQTTALGNAKIAEQGALAGEHNAQAGTANARTSKIKQDMDKPPAAAKPQALTSELTKAFFSDPMKDADGNPLLDSQKRPVSQIDTGKLANFMQFVSRPGVSQNQNAALPQYMNAFGAQTGNTPPGAVDLGDVVAAQKAAPAAPAPKAKPNLQDWLTKAKQANPGVSDDDLTAYYNKKYGG